MLNRIPIGILVGLVGVAGATLLGVPGIAAADAPPLPDINAFPSAKPSDYTVQDGAWYAFGAPDGVTCVLDKQSGGYGCSGPIPAAPGGAKLLSAAPSGAPGFASSAQSLYGVVEGAKAAAEHQAQLPDGQLWHRRGRHELPEQR